VKLQAAYNDKGWRPMAVSREEAEAAESYVVNKGLKFLRLADARGERWKTSDSTAMPTNILIDKGGRVVRIVPGCTRDGRNAQILSEEIATLLSTPAARIAEPKATPNK